MAINKKLISFKTQANFEAQLTGGNILDSSIVFIQDSKKIWTHGTYFDCSAVEALVKTLIGEDAGKSVRTIANEELAAQLIADNASDSLDTLKEIATWIQQHPEDASEMNEAIAANTASINSLTTSKADKATTIAGYGITDAVTGVKGSAESAYRKGNVDITKANIGLGNVDNTADANKSVNYATSAGTATNLSANPSLAASGNNITVTAGGKTSSAFTVPYATTAGSATSATSATKATQDASGNTITSTYATKTALNSKVDHDGTVTKIVALTQSQYDALSSKSSTTLYVVTD